VRAHRRLAELRARGVCATYADVLRELNERDAGRQAAPLRAPADAVIIDTTALDAEAVFARACDIVMRALAGSH
jgi:cytidylate kinase